ncbi:thiamine phosphate synthase [Candidatus Pelagibacter bacterium]|nr:thiamine phosphate synthase [Candidatus Pelagibacter bacterium]
MFLQKKKYFFIIESIKDIELKNIKNFGKFCIIYRNNSEENIEKLKKFRLNCKLKKIPLYIANNIKLLNSLKADGLYISAFNKSLNINYLKGLVKIIGGAHNIKEINIKKQQNCSYILLSRLFETSYPNKKGHLGVVKFNLFSKLVNARLVPLGGINLDNLKKLNIVECEAIAMSSLIKRKTQENLKNFR